MTFSKKILSVFIVVLIVHAKSLLAYDLTESFSIEGTLTSVAQNAQLDNVFKEDGSKQSDTTRAAVVLDIGANYRLTERDEFQLTYSFAEGEAINGLEAFTLAPYADDLEEDLKDINNSGRYNLLEAWYKHTFEFSDVSALGATLGIIEAPAYIDGNEYANDEVSQFMNDIFVNSTLANLPVYDVGAALEIELGEWSVNAVVMDSENDDRNDYMYYAVQISRQVSTQWGTGNYRLYAFSTDSEFIDNDSTGEDSLSGLGISIDQQISESVGIFARLGIQDDEVPVDHDEMFSLGLSVAGNNWNRPNDVVAAGFAFLNGAKESGIDDTTALEAYYSLVFSDYFDLTADIQWVEDDLRDEKNPEGLISGVRFNANF